MSARPRQRGFRIPEQYLLPWSPQSTVSAQQVARMLDCGLTTVYRMIQAGELEAYQVRPGNRQGKRKMKTNSPLRIYYDSVIAHIERMHKEAGVEKRF